MDRNMRQSYVNSGPRSLPHMGGNGHKRHNNGSGHSSNGHSGARLSPPVQSPPVLNPNQHQDDIINYVYDSWNKVTRELERGSPEAMYYQELTAPRQLANFRPFNLEELWARRMVQSINRKHRS